MKLAALPQNSEEDSASRLPRAVLSGHHWWSFRRPCIPRRQETLEKERQFTPLPHCSRLRQEYADSRCQSTPIATEAPAWPHGNRREPIHRSRKYQVLNLSDRLRLQDVISSSSSSPACWPQDELTSVPQRISTISETLQVLTPLTYILAMASREHAHCACLSRCSWDKTPSRELVVLSRGFPGRKIEYWIIWIYQQTLLFSYETQEKYTKPLEVMEV